MIIVIIYKFSGAIFPKGSLYFLCAGSSDSKLLHAAVCYDQYIFQSLAYGSTRGLAWSMMTPLFLVIITKKKIIAM